MRHAFSQPIGIGEIETALWRVFGSSVPSKVAYLLFRKKRKVQKSTGVSGPVVWFYCVSWPNSSTFLLIYT